MKSRRLERCAALATAMMALAAVPVCAQTYSSSATVARINGNTSVTGIMNDDTAAGVPGALGAATVDTDRQLMTDVVNALSADPRMSGARLEVAVSEGRVDLGGVAQDMAQASTARSIAAGVAGAANVN